MSPIAAWRPMHRGRIAKKRKKREREKKIFTKNEPSLQTGGYCGVTLFGTGDRFHARKAVISCKTFKQKTIKGGRIKTCAGSCKRPQNVLGDGRLGRIK